MSAETPWPICQLCRAIPWSFFCQPVAGESFEPRRKYNFQASFAAFRDSASRGCHACMLFYGAVLEPFKSQLHTAPVYLESLFEESSELAKTVGLTVDLNHIIRLEGNAESRLKSPEYQCPYGQFEFAPVGEIGWTVDETKISPNAKNYQDLISLYKDDERAFEYVKASLNKCMEDHGGPCDMVSFPLTPRRSGTITIVHGKRGMTTAPTRLVDIGSDDGTDPPRVVPGARCLHHENPGYIALSYCNGFVPENPPWQLTTHTQAIFEERLPLNSFPQTLRDALEWTRRLGDRFIWIDNLCIIQDSVEDWNREALQMASVYGCATVTLVAAAGSIYGGMTDRRNPLRNSACCFKPRVEAPETSPPVFLLPQGQKSAPQIAIPTESRGWCYQEDALSPRLVRFSFNGVEFQCLGDKTKVGRLRALERLTPHKPHQWYMIWYAFIERYSQMQLTFATDKLTAFSGIVANKGKTDTYVAGVYEDDVWAGLLWARDDKLFLTKPGYRYGRFVAPSWSWASLDVPVLFHEAKNRLNRKIQLDSSPWDPQLHSIEAKPATMNKMGPVEGGELVLTAYAITATTSLDQPNIFSVDQAEQLPGRQWLLSSTCGSLVGEVVYDCASEARENETLHCLLLHVADIDQCNKNSVFGLGIALRDSLHSSRNETYSRIGYIQFVPAFAKLAKRSRFRII